jgi:hypothetical protein
MFGCNMFKWAHLLHAISKNKTDSIRQIFHDAGPAEGLKLINTTVALSQGETTTLLIDASRKNCYVETMQLLLENGPNPNEIIEMGGYSLSAVCVVRTREKAKILFEYGPNPELNSCLHIQGKLCKQASQVGDKQRYGF